LPAALLTPAASYMTIRAMATDIPNSPDPHPYCLPITVASETMKEVWELGIPPDPTKRVKSSLFSFIITPITFISCATNHAITGMTIASLLIILCKFLQEIAPAP